MKRYPKQFLELSPKYTEFASAAIALLPIPYEGGVSYGRGAAGGPDAIVKASQYLELYDESLKAEPYRIGIVTVEPPTISTDALSMQRAIYQASRDLLNQDKFVVVIGGDHSVTTGHFRALCEKYGSLSVIQLDAHADLREDYGGSPLSHACVMSRVLELTHNSLQLGIRSMSIEEAQKIQRENLAVFTLEDYRSGALDLDAELIRLPNPVYLTLDVDVFDWSVVRSTGTPEPGGLLWDEATELLRKIFNSKNIISFDVVELAHNRFDRNSAFAVAKIIYKMLGYKLAVEISSKNTDWPESPAGPFFRCHEA